MPFFGRFRVTRRDFPLQGWQTIWLEAVSPPMGGHPRALMIGSISVYIRADQTGQHVPVGGTYTVTFVPDEDP